MWLAGVRGEGSGQVIQRGGAGCSRSAIAGRKPLPCRQGTGRRVHRRPRPGRPTRKRGSPSRAGVPSFPFQTGNRRPLQKRRAYPLPAAIPDTGTPGADPPLPVWTWNSSGRAARWYSATPPSPWATCRCTRFPRKPGWPRRRKPAPGRRQARRHGPEAPASASG